MKYVSTRGHGHALEFDDVLLTGLATDGGLFIPERWPSFELTDFRALARRSYPECAFHVIRPFVGGMIQDPALERMIEDAYAQFDHPAVAPLRQIDSNDWLVELFHGPTLAFKDFALQLLGRMFDHVLARRQDRVTVVGATSGDTGSAAIEACRGCENIDIFVLFPKGRVSDIQRLQMTTVAADNVHAVAVEGTFDDCQDLVKAMFNDAPFRAAHKLSAFNSINWARVMIQIVYYIVAATRAGAPDRRVSFAVPTGNFGNVLAGWAAWKTGLPVEKLVIGTNRNDILFRFLKPAPCKRRRSRRPFLRAWISRLPAISSGSCTTCLTGTAWPSGTGWKISGGTDAVPWTTRACNARNTSSWRPVSMTRGPGRP